LQSYVAIIPLIEIIINSNFQDLFDNSNELNDAKDEFDRCYQAFTPLLRNGESAKNMQDIIDAHKHYAEILEYDEDNLGAPDYTWGNDLTDNYIAAANRLAQAAYYYYRAFNELGTFCYDAADFYKVNQADASTLRYGTMKDKAKDAINKTLSFAKQEGVDWEDLTQNEIDKLKKYAKIIWFESIIKKDGILTIGTALNEGNASNWSAFVDGLSTSQGWGAKLSKKTAAYALSPLTQYIDFWNQTFRDWNHWDAQKDGQIIFSDQSGRSWYFGQDLVIKDHINGFDVDQDNNLQTIDSLKNLLANWDAPVNHDDEEEEEELLDL
jgi:hypothetical protein